MEEPDVGFDFYEFPAELRLAVFDEFSGLDTSTLKEAALVCPDWTDHSQSALFHTTLIDNLKRLRRFVRRVSNINKSRVCYLLLEGMWENAESIAKVHRAVADPCFGGCPKLQGLILRGEGIVCAEDPNFCSIIQILQPRILCLQVRPKFSRELSIQCSSVIELIIPACTHPGLSSCRELFPRLESLRICALCSTRRKVQAVFKCYHHNNCISTLKSQKVFVVVQILSTCEVLNEMRDEIDHYQKEAAGIPVFACRCVPISDQGEQSMEEKKKDTMDIIAPIVEID
ncbi:hypothetical protein SISNIDRAFT_486743 [Sistotremastrum niveocremeum HHB9708]|uniref:F-box domain-containing protein n=1 Tax=Sistotremastrum niveocremeum HHB9708 TaxID=1314777 RepID=A0A164TAK0_9AGAM|nr:hypothetical protein SISNIDRAFT_486743 [Sistotremastrum niveocremeum HHB9708]